MDYPEMKNNQFGIPFRLLETIDSPPIEFDVHPTTITAPSEKSPIPRKIPT